MLFMTTRGNGATEPAVFISYRGGDERWAPDLVYTALTAEFGEGVVFKAGYDLRAGEEFPAILEQRAASCPVMIVCIGPGWLVARNADGTRRLDEPDDWVRREVEIALRNGNDVIPLLLGSLDEISIPTVSELPPDLAPLVRRQAFRLEPGGRLRITLPDLAARVADLVPGLARRIEKESGSAIVARIRIGDLRGKATAVRAHEGVTRPIDADVQVDRVSKSGEAMAVDMPHQGRG